jgi:hypothetical protein
MRILLFYLTIIIISVSCSSIKPAAKKDFSALGFVKAEVKKYDIDGCGFMIFLEDGNKLNPDKLEDKFKVDGLAIWIKYGVKKNAMSICMAGPNISVVEIAKREP